MNASLIERLQRLPWPLPALIAWSAGWAAAAVCLQGDARPWALPAGTTIAAALALMTCDGLRRRAIAALGFPLSALVLFGPSAMPPPLLWAAALGLLLLVYPLRAWRDAPFFPTPALALEGLDLIVDTPPRRVLDAGCGLGHGLRALQRQWPQAELHGVEWSAPMAWLSRRLVPAARVRHGDMWAESWAGYDLVYLFQRPESMPRAWAKAQAELDGWLVSLEFEVPGVAPVARLDAGRRTVHVYRVGSGAQDAPATASTAPAAGR